MNGETEQGTESLGGILQRRPRPTPGCSAIKEEEESLSCISASSEVEGYDMIYLTAIGLTPGGSSTIHIYLQTVHRTTQLTN
jgi:hypothetical protein